MSPLTNCNCIIVDSSSEYDESESDDDGDSDSSNQETPIASTPERSPSRSASPLTIQSIQGWFKFRLYH